MRWASLFCTIAFDHITGESAADLLTSGSERSFFLFELAIATIDGGEHPEEDAHDREDDPGRRPGVIEEPGDKIDGGGKQENTTPATVSVTFWRAAAPAKCFCRKVGSCRNRSGCHRIRTGTRRLPRSSTGRRRTKDFHHQGAGREQRSDGRHDAENNTAAMATVVRDFDSRCSLLRSARVWGSRWMI